MKDNIVKILLFLLIAVIPAYNLYGLLTDEKMITSAAVDGDFSEDLTLLNIKDIEKKIDSLVEERQSNREKERIKEERKKNYERISKQIKSGKINFKQELSDTLIVGDSLMNALQLYKIIDESNIISMVSANFNHLEDNYSTIVANNPKKLVLHYGINMCEDSDERREAFISQYSAILKRLKKDIPDTVIYISGIFNVSGEASERFPCVSAYNDALKSMCKKLGVKFLDNSKCFNGDETYYGTDGIHLKKEFYSEAWIPNLLLTFYS